MILRNSKLVLAMNELKQFFTQHWLYLAVRAACKINLFDVVAQHTFSKSQLLDALDTNKQATSHLIDALTIHGFLKDLDGLISLTKLSEPLTDSSPNNLKYACLLWGGEHVDVWQNLDKTISSGKPVFPEMFGKRFFDYLEEDESKSSEYHKAMYEYARDDYQGIHTSIDLSGIGSCTDVGGANGALVEQLSGHYPTVKFTIFDKQNHSSPNLTNVNFVQGDFFDGIPVLGEVYLLSRVLHDWNDESALQILKSCFHSLPKGGELYVIENDLSKLGDGGHLLSLNMMAVCESFERTQDQYVKLLNESGFAIKTLKNHNQLLVIKAVKP